MKYIKQHNINFNLFHLQSTKVTIQLHYASMLITINKKLNCLLHSLKNRDHQAFIDSLVIPLT